MAQEFHIGQVFEGEYPPDAAVFCNESGGKCYIDEIEQKEGKRQFKIVAVPEPQLEELKANKLRELKCAHQEAEEKAWLNSSLGYPINANERANRDLDGLLFSIGEGSTQFCDYKNNFHEVSKSQCLTLKSEIVQNASSLYQQKWKLRNKIEHVQSKEELDSIKIQFSNLDFSGAR